MFVFGSTRTVPTSIVVTGSIRLISIVPGRIVGTVSAIRRDLFSILLGMSALIRSWVGTSSSTGPVYLVDGLTVRIHPLQVNFRDFYDTLHEVE